MEVLALLYTFLLVTICLLLAVVLYRTGRPQQEQQGIEALRNWLAQRLAAQAEENARQLAEIRHTVDEQLQDALQKRVTESFQAVNAQLEQVYKGLGEMQTLAADVGGLKQAKENARQQAALAQQNEAALRSVSDALQTAVQNMSATLAQGQTGQQAALERRLNSLQQQNAQQMEQLRNSPNEGMKALQEENARKLDEIRHTVDEQLQDALQKRVTERRCKNV